MRQEVAGTTPEADADLTLTERVAAARAALAENSERMAAAAGERMAAAAERLRATRYSLANGRSQREQLHESAYARLRAKLAVFSRGRHRVSISRAGAARSPAPPAGA